MIILGLFTFLWWKYTRFSKKKIETIEGRTINTIYILGVISISALSSFSAVFYFSAGVIINFDFFIELIPPFLLCAFDLNQ